MINKEINFTSEAKIGGCSGKEGSFPPYFIFIKNEMFEKIEFNFLLGWNASSFVGTWPCCNKVINLKAK